MRRGIGLAVVMAVLGLPAVASAGTECVPNISIPNCPASAANEPTIATAVTNATSGDTIVIGPGTFNESVSDGGTKALHFVGEGEAQTTIQGGGSPAMKLSAGSTVSNLTIDLYPFQGNTGLELAGTATNVAIEQTASIKDNIGVQLEGGTFTHGSITLPVNIANDAGYGGAIGSGLIADSTITANQGVNDVGTGTPTVVRDAITADQGVIVGLAGTVDDAVIHTVPGPLPEVGIGMSPLAAATTLVVRHDTIAGSDAAGSTGLMILGSDAAAPSTTAVTLESSILRGYGTSIDAEAHSVTFPVTTNVAVSRSLWDAASERIQQTGPFAHATITPDAHSSNADPLFVNAAGGDYHLQAGSPAIDAGEPTIASGESTTDLDGHPRAVAGHAGGGATDIGAYEFQPHAPTATALVSSSAITLGEPVTFAATGGDASPGDSVAFTWSFDDGSTATGAMVTHIFTAPGMHTGTVTVTDLDGFTATAQATVTVSAGLSKPTLTKLRIKPAKLRNGQKAKISYVDSEPGTVSFTVERFKKHHRFLDVGAFMHKSVAGSNHLTFRVRHRLPGRYRIVAIPRDAAGAGRAVNVRFRVKA